MRGFALVAGLLALLLLCHAREQWPPADVLAEGARLAVSEEGLSPDRGAGVLAVLGAQAAAGEVPEAFSQEVLDVSFQCDVRVGEGASVVGYSKEGLAPAVYQEISDDLEKKGWRAVASGSECQGTFVKQAGQYRWLYASCVQIGQWTAVVLQVQGMEEGA